ncbi:MAG: DNA recombination protein RmuC [Actinobacteria bacterium]|nr:DNA recombination protein RmuC [Actinomycetota bacterium]
MEIITLLLALAIAILLTFVVVIFASKARSRAVEADLVSRLDRQDQVLQELKGKSELGDKGQDLIREELVRASRTLAAIQVDLDARKRLEEENREMVKRLESVIAGSYAKGRAGENILRETLKLFPPGMVETDFQVGGRVVEFALKLFDGKVLPIDSKWPSTPLLLALDEEKDEARRLSIIASIEKEVGRRVREVAGYIDPVKTVPWAVAALPDSVFSVCKRAFLDAYKCRVILMSYSMAIPYILTFYSLHLQYSRSIDMGNLQAHIIDIDHHLKEIELVVENRIARGSTMIANAYAELRQSLGKVRGSLSYLQTLDAPDTSAEIERGPVEIGDGAGD